MANNPWKYTAALVLVLGGATAQAEHIGIVATVNDSVITTTDLDERRALVMENSGIPNTAENQQRVTPRVVQSLVDEALELQEAKHQSITISDADVDKMLDTMAESKNGPPGSLKKSVEAKGLSLRSLKSQIRAQLAWNKVVQRKLRRNVTVSRDELIRAQQAQAADPGTSEAHITALIVPITQTSKPEALQAVTRDIASSLKAGQDFTFIAARYIDSKDVLLNPPVWVNEETLPADVEAALKDLKPGEVSEPLRTGNAVQFVKLLERKSVRKASPSTEVTIKQITIDVPPNPKKPMLTKLSDAGHILHDNPGSCEDAKLPALPVPADVKFAHLKVADLTPEQRSVVLRMDVGDLSEPLVSPGRLRFVQLCERIEAAAGAAELEALRQQLFAEKIELEAQKHLRNLKRDASIDIRSDDK